MGWLWLILDLVIAAGSDVDEANRPTLIISLAEQQPVGAEQEPVNMKRLEPWKLMLLIKL